MIVADTPGMMNSFLILVQLLWCQIFSPMRTDRHHIRCSIRKKNSGSAECDLCHMMGEIANRMSHRLIFCSDAARGSVIISSEMCSDAASFTCPNNSHQRVCTLLIHDDLCRFYHCFH